MSGFGPQSLGYSASKPLTIEACNGINQLGHINEPCHTSYMVYSNKSTSSLLIRLAEKCTVLKVQLCDTIRFNAKEFQNQASLAHEESYKTLNEMLALYIESFHHIERRNLQGYMLRSSVRFERHIYYQQSKFANVRWKNIMMIPRSL